MSKIRVIHLIPRKLIYGSYALLSEIYYGMQKNYSQEIEQEVVCIAGGKGFSNFELPSTTVDIKDVGKVVMAHQNTVVLFYRLAGIGYSEAYDQVKGKVPFIVINLTECENCAGVSACDALVTVSSKMHKALKLKFTKLNVVLIKNGVHESRFSSIEKMKNPKRDGRFFVIGRMNNFNHVKHPSDWVRWSYSLRASKPIWQDYLGSGTKLKDAAKQKGKYKALALNNILNLPGRIDDIKTKIGYVKSWDLFVYEIPGTEGISMSLLEALACGIPALINNKPGNNEIIVNGVNGWICNSREEMHARIKDYCSNPKKLGSLKKSTIKHFRSHLSGEIMVKKYVNLIKSFL